MARKVTQTGRPAPTGLTRSSALQERLEAAVWELRWAASADVAELLPGAVLPGLLINPTGLPSGPPRLLAPYSLSLACGHLTLEALLDVKGGAAAASALQIAAITAEKLQVLSPRLSDMHGAAAAAVSLARRTCVAVSYRMTGAWNALGRLTRGCVVEPGLLHAHISNAPSCSCTLTPPPPPTALGSLLVCAGRCSHLAQPGLCHRSSQPGAGPGPPPGACLPAAHGTHAVLHQDDPCAPRGSAS